MADGIDLSVRAGRALAVTGPNGAGKSTLALTLAGLLPPAGGDRRRDRPRSRRGPARAPIRWKSRQLLTRIGTVFQDPEHQFVAATVRDELAVGPQAARLPAPPRSARSSTNCSADCGSSHLAEANPFTLSGGEKRRLSVATVLATRPRVLVLDEPTFGQDSRTWRELRRPAGRARRRGHALVAVTHDADFVRGPGRRGVRARRPRGPGGAPMSVLAPVGTTSALGRLNPVAKLAATFLITLALVLTHRLGVGDGRPAARARGALRRAGSANGVLQRPLPAGVDRRTAHRAHHAALRPGVRRELLRVLADPRHRGLARVWPSPPAARARHRAAGRRAVHHVDPTDLADGLAQVGETAEPLRARRSGRHCGSSASSSTTGARCELARRASGVADRGLLRRLLGQAFALLVLSIRRGSKLATAMEARGFGGATRRTWARDSVFGARDWFAIAVGFAIAIAAVTVAVATGSWNFVLR